MLEISECERAEGRDRGREECSLTSQTNCCGCAERVSCVVGYSFCSLLVCYRVSTPLLSPPLAILSLLVGEYFSFFACIFSWLSSALLLLLAHSLFSLVSIFLFCYSIFRSILALTLSMLSTFVTYKWSSPKTIHSAEFRQLIEGIMGLFVMVSRVHASVDAEATVMKPE